MSRARNAQLVENQNERGGFNLLAQLARRTPRNNRHHNKQRQHIERCQTNHHSLRTGTHRSGGVLGFCGGDRDHLNTAEGEHHDRQRKPDRAEPVGHEPAVVDKISGADRRM